MGPVQTTIRSMNGVLIEAAKLLLWARERLPEEELQEFDLRCSGLHERSQAACERIRSLLSGTWGEEEDSDDG